MEFLENVLRLERAGRFRDALLALEESAMPPRARIAADVVRAGLLDSVGHHSKAMALATSLLRSKQLPLVDRSACEYVVGSVLIKVGQTVEAIARFQRSASQARDAAAPERTFAAELRLLIVLSEHSGPGASAALLADVRKLATRLGDPHATATLHLFVAELDAKRGLLENAARHSAIARALLSSSPNVYLEAFGLNLDMGISILRCRFGDAQSFAHRATELAEQAGVERIRQAVRGNLGTLYFEVGDYCRALEHFEAVLASAPASGATAVTSLDNLARTQLSLGHLDLCRATLERIESSILRVEDRQLYEYRYAALTMIQLLTAEGRIDDALSGATSLLELASRTGDGLLINHIQLIRAELLQRRGETARSMALLADVVPGLSIISPDLYAYSEQILACALAADGKPGAEAHHDRASRMYGALGSAPRQRALAVRWNQARAEALLDGANQGGLADSTQTVSSSNIQQLLHGMATVFTHATRPELVAGELLQILDAADCVDTARATVQGKTEAEQPIGRPIKSRHSPDVPERRLSVGFRDDREVQLHIRPKSDIESVATVNAVTLLLAALQEVQRARAEREERATLWPIEELPDDQRSVISGRMRELMTYARKIARTKVNVLITVESGTGKEILARAIHDFSDRAGKAFVPFNCSAIPRDLLESQLFGHRRGAFTGADRDQLGLIRSARDGTLFLDEVGELGLDLQPKLLRFLESGEISPLGEPALTIDVRIVAATNANLEDAVRAGRFREDLFYRLNVVRLSIPPLRERRDEIPALVNHFVDRAAEEFRKGQLRVADETMERLLLYRWPGNVRQLQNEMRRMVALTEPESTLLPHAISEEILGALPIFRHAPINGREIAVDLDEQLTPALARVEREMIKTSLRTHDGKVNAVAKALGISRKGLYLKRQRLGL